MLHQSKKLNETKEQNLAQSFITTEYLKKPSSIPSFFLNLLHLIHFLVVRYIYALFLELCMDLCSIQGLETSLYEGKCEIHLSIIGILPKIWQFYFHTKCLLPFIVMSFVPYQQRSYSIIINVRQSVCYGQQETRFSTTKVEV